MKKNDCQLISMLRQFWKSKLFRIMRTTFFIIVFSITQILAANSYSQSTRLSLNLKNVSTKTVLSQIEDKSEFYFIYDATVVDVEKKVSIELKDEPISKVLDELFEGTDVIYKINNRQIALTSEYSATGSQQQKTVSGRVTDSSGALLPGVTVVIKGQAKGTITDADGSYSISNIPSGGTLVFSFVGMKTQEISISGKSIINIVMTDETVGIDEVVAIGYGTQKKGALTGSVAKADSKVLETRPVIGATNALQGTMPGVTIIRGSTRPGQHDATIQIRGYSSMAGAKPLILIDGIAGDLNLINPSDIDNVTVLKDASASIYGARASDGVIIVTTKKGKSGKPQISYSGNFGIKKLGYLKEMPTTSQLIDVYNEFRTNMGLSPTSQDVVSKIKGGSSEVNLSGSWMAGFETYPGFYGYTDWSHEILGNGTQQNHNVDISGGGENNTYLFSARYNRDGGFFKFGDPQVSNKYNLSANNSFKNLFNRLDIDTRIQFDNEITDEPSQVDYALNQLNYMWRFIPMYNPSGQFYMWQGFSNPANALANGGRTNLRHDRLTFNAKGDLRILDGLKLTAQYGTVISNDATKLNVRSYPEYGWDKDKVEFMRNSINWAIYQTGYQRYSSYTSYLDYIKTYATKHNFSLMAGAAHEENVANTGSMSGANFLSNDIFTLNMSDKTDIKYLSANTYASNWALTSFFGRLGYNYEGKYLIDLTLRTDGSSKFAPEKRWSSMFPAVLAAWNLGNESFIRSMNAFNNLKLRLSWGKSGNQELSFGNYDYISLININNSAYDFGETGVNFPGATSGVASQERTWETITTYNAGIDFAVLNSRLSGSFDVYKKRNSDMLVNQALPALFGASAPTQNIGELKSKGFEFTLGWKDKIADFTYGISFILSDSKNKLVSLKGSDTKAEGLVYAREGYPLQSYFGYVYEGIIQNESQLAEYKKLGGIVPARIGIGDAMYKDVDGDGKITAFGDDGKSGDMVYLGNRMPRYTYSSNINLSYKNFDLSIFLQGVGKQNIMRTGALATPYYYWWWSPMEYFVGKTWTPERTNAEFPRGVMGARGWDDIRDWNYVRSSDAPYRLINNAYLRVKVITLAYRLPKSFCQKIKLQNVRIYISGEDLFTFAKGTWDNSFDPEEGWLRTDADSYPFSKTLSMGLDVKF